MSSLVVLQANDLQQLKFLYQGSTRLKVTCFDLSPSLIILGANSGTIYVLDHETLHLKNQIPAGNGGVMQLCLSSDERQVACALSNGTIMVFEMMQTGAQLLMSSLEHQGNTVTSLVWAPGQPELYVGDSTGRVSMLHVSKSKTAALFRSSCLHLMTLESSITQLDYREGYLLVSTLTRSYVCNTSLETFSQVGTKLRQGEFGGCFCQVNTSATLPSFKDFTKGLEDLQASATFSDKFGLSECYEAVEEEKSYQRSFLGRERPGRSILPMLACRVFCARPGTRIWEADHSGKVLATHQLKSALIVSPAEVLLTDGSFQEEELISEINNLPSIASNNIPDHGRVTGNTFPKATHPSVSVSFTKMLSFYNKYILATSAYGLYFIDPAASKVLMWVSVSDGIADIKISGNSLIYRSGSGCIQNLIITTVDLAILILHTRKLYIQCAHLCLKKQEAFETSEFLSRLGVNILRDLSDNISSNIIKEKINEIKYCVDSSKRENHSNITKIASVTYVKNKSFKTEELKANLNAALKEHSSLLNKSFTRCNSEPLLRRNQLDVEGGSAKQGTVSMESSPMKQLRNKVTESSLNTASKHISCDEAVLKSPDNPTLGRRSYGQKCSDNHVFDLGHRDCVSKTSCSLQSDSLTNQESSLDMYEDPLFTPERSPSPDLEAASRIFLDSHPKPSNPHTSHSFYNLAYAPIHPGSEAATLLQDLMEVVTSNVVDTFTLGTKTITERLKSVAPRLSTPRGEAEGRAPVPELKGAHSNIDTKDTSLSDSDTAGDFNNAVLIPTKTKKKQPKRHFTLQEGDCSNQGDQEEHLPQFELPGVVRNLHELVCATVQQVTNTDDPEGRQALLCHWLEVFCHTVQQIQCNNKPIVSQDQGEEGPVSLSSIDSIHSLCSADASGESLHWDSMDIGFDPSALKTDVLEQITDLFLNCLQSGVVATNTHSWRTPLRTDLPQHPMTPPEVKRKDAFYAQVIASDCGLLQYTHLMNALESLGHHYYILTWVALMEKITRDGNSLPSQPLPDIVCNLDFTRSQYVSILFSVASSGSTKNLISVAVQMENALVVQDVIFLLHYMVAHQVEMNCSLSRSHLPKLLQQYLIEFSHHKNLINAYLNHWSLYSELQSDILSAVLNEEGLSHAQYSCKCGLPLPRRREVVKEDLAEIILLHDIINPCGLAEVCQRYGYWKGYCTINLAYHLQTSAQLSSFVFQYGDTSLLECFLEELHCDDFGMVLSTLAKMTSKDVSVMKCFQCQTQIPFPEKQCVSESKEESNESVSLQFPDNSLKGPHQAETRSETLNSAITTVIEDVCVGNMKHLWEVVVTMLLYRISAASVLQLLSAVEDSIPPGVLSERVYSWCILASLADQQSPVARCALLDSLTGASRKPYSHKVLQTLHRSPPGKSIQRLMEGGSSHHHHTEESPNTIIVQSGSSRPPSSLEQKQPSDAAPQSHHHWGVWAEVLEGVCSGCHLYLPTQALGCCG